MVKKKLQKAEDFIGWKSDDGLLEVVEIHGKQGRNRIFKVICHKCKEDKELFPDGYFVSTKVRLVNGHKPCGCSNRRKWSKEQYLVLACRAAKGRFIVHGFAEDFKGVYTKLDLECSTDGFKWAARIDNIVNGATGCFHCSVSARKTNEQEALDKCKAICENEGYELIGFIGRYKNCYTRFEYRCAVHGKQNVSYNNFVNHSTRCPLCAKERQKDLGNGNGYYPERKDEKIICMF